MKTRPARKGMHNDIPARLGASGTASRASHASRWGARPMLLQGPLGFQPTRKLQLLQQCARIGYTPHLGQSIKPSVFMIQGRRPRTCLQNYPTT